MPRFKCNSLWKYNQVHLFCHFVKLVSPLIKSNVMCAKELSYGKLLYDLLLVNI